MKGLQLVVVGILVALCGGAHAQIANPEKPIRLINPFPPGSPVEFIGRLVSERLSKAWGKPVLLESRSGAGGTIGADFVAKSAPDGYTLLVTTPSTLAVAPTAQDCRDLMIDATIDVCNLDASWGGGPSVWLRVARMAECFGVLMGHHGEPVLGSHLLAAVRNGTYVETHHPERDPVFHRMVTGRGEISGGEYVLPQAPGWVVGFDADFIARYRVN